MVKQWFDNNANNAIHDRIFTPLSGVALKSGLFVDVFNNNRAYLKTIDMDAMLYWFRKKAGKEARGQPYRGHFEDNIKGQTAGLVLMGAGNALRWVEDDELRAIVDKLIDEIKDCSESDGYLMAIPKEEFGTLEYPHYVRIWLTYGLYAAALGGKPDALDMLRKWQDWFNRCDDLPIIKYLSLSFQGVVASPFVYNTPIGKREDIDTTIQYYEEDWRLGQFIMKERDSIHKRNQPGKEPHPHGTELEALEGYLDLYRATGKHYYLRAVLNAYDMYKRDWQHPGGGIVMCEFLDAYPKCYWLSPSKPYNELCCTSFWILLNQRLHRLFPSEERYAAEIEASLYNIAIASQDGSEGIRYFSWIHGHKPDSGKVHCCCGVGTRLYGMLPEFIYSVSDDALYVDLYAASEIEWQNEGGPVHIELKTDMPNDDKVEIAVNPEIAHEFTVYLRIPAWTKQDVDVSINGTIAGRASSGSYFEARRVWKKGDTINFTLPFAFRLTKYVGAEETDNSDRYAYEYGPLLMAFKGELNAYGHIRIEQNPLQYQSWLTPGDAPLTFNIKNADNVKLVPYYILGSREPFTCYPLFPIQRDHYDPKERATSQSW